MHTARSTVLGPVRSGQLLASFPGETWDVPGRRVKLILHGLQKSSASLVLRISLSAGARGSVVAGNLYTYGEGPAAGADTRGRFFPVTLALDITVALRRLSGAEQVDVYLTILDAHGRELADEMLSLQGVELEVEE